MSDDQYVTITLASPDLVRTHLDAICDLYADAFSEPPFAWPTGEAERHRAMMVRLIGDPSFGAALAFTGGDLAGFVYGQSLRAKTRWWEGFVVAVPDEVIEEWSGRTFAVIDLAVRAGLQRRGVGRGLLETLLTSRRESRATLAVQPQAPGPHAFYAAIGGWELLGRQHVPNEGYVHSDFDIYIKELRAESNP